MLVIRSTLLVPPHLHSVILASHPLLLGMSRGREIVVPFRRFAEGKCLSQFTSRGTAPDHHFFFLLFKSVVLNFGARLDLSENQTSASDPFS